MTDFFRLLCSFLLSLALLACSGLSSKPDLFMPAQKDFSERLRWRDIAGAARHFTPGLEEEFRLQLSALTDLHITDVRMESADYAPDGRRVTTWTVLEFFLLPSTTVQTLRYRQEWEYAGDERFPGGKWVIVTPFPEIQGPAKKDSG